MKIVNLHLSTWLRPYTLHPTTNRNSTLHHIRIKDRPPILHHPKSTMPLAHKSFPFGFGREKPYLTWDSEGNSIIWSDFLIVQRWQFNPDLAERPARVQQSVSCSVWLTFWRSSHTIILSLQVWVLFSGNYVLFTLSLILAIFVLATTIQPAIRPWV